MYIRRQDAIDSIEDSIGLIDRALNDMDILNERKILERERKALMSLRDDMKSIPAADFVDKATYDQLLAENAKLKKQVSALHGEWIRYGAEKWYCSKCERTIECEQCSLPNFCEDCGASMKP